MGNIRFDGMSPRSPACIALPCLVLLSACSPAPHTVDLVAEKAAVLERDHAWQAAVDEKTDAEKIMSFVAEDGVVFGSGEPTLDTRAALRKAVSGLTADPSFHEHWGWSRV